MIGHLFKLIWNRKRSNFLIMLEIFFSFLVLYAVAVVGIYYLDNYQKPLGYEWKPLWSVELDFKESSPAEVSARIQELMRMAEGFEEVEAAALSNMPPFSNSSWNSSVEINGRPVDFAINEATDKYAQVVGLKITNGRWFSREDDAATDKELVVINQKMASAAFGTQNPVGKKLYEPEPEEKPMIVVGVMSDFRKDGEFAAPENVVFSRVNVQDTTSRNASTGARSKLPRYLLLRMSPGTTASFEETLYKKMQAVGGNWSFEIKPVSQLRDRKHATFLTPLIIAGIISGFLLLMVALGLVGVIWQNVTARSAEIGLRRATGATAVNILTQVQLELALVASLGMAFGILLVLQFPILKVVAGISVKVYLLALLVSMAIIYLITLLSGLYPSLLATRVQPTQALNSD